MKKIIFVLCFMFLYANAAQIGFCPHNDGRCHEGVRDSGRGLYILAETLNALAKPITMMLNASVHSSGIR